MPVIILPNVAFIAIRAYAAYSYLYYEKDESLIGDGEFDELCKWLLANYDLVKPHDINDYLDKEALSAGTGYAISGRVCGLTKKWADEQLHEAKAKRRKPKKQTNKPAAVRNKVDCDMTFLD